MLKAMAIGVGGVIAIVVVGFGVLRATGLWDRLLPPAPRQPIDFATLEPGERPNRYLVCPAGLCERATLHAASPVFPVPAAALAAAVRDVLARQPALVIESDAGDVLDVVQRTPLMRWPDRITLRIVPLGPTESGIAIFSRSTYGRSDLGANERRVRAWLDELAATLP